MKKFEEIKFISAMLIFGSIGIFVRNIALPSAAIVQWRTIIGSIFLFLLFICTKKKIEYGKIKENLAALIAAGVVLGGNWAFLFEAYRHTTVGMATMLYYCAPIIVFFLSVVVLKEGTAKRQIVGIIAAVLGMLTINVVGQDMGLSFMGASCGLISALLYAALMLANKYIKGIPGVVSTWIQLMIAAVVMSLYILVSTGKFIYIPAKKDVLLVLIVGILHTGIACNLYFSSMQKMAGQSVSILSYVDPASALLFAFIFLGERLTGLQLIGAVLIFGGVMYSQIPGKKQ